MSAPFWQSKTLNEMTHEEWEQLCDGCAKCCLHKLENADTGEIFYTDVACRYLNTSRCVCQAYQNRSSLVAECLTLTKDNIHEATWLPSTCAYRLLAQGQSLPEWHPLVSGSRASVHQAGFSVQGRVVSEHNIHPDDIEERVVTWV